MRLRIKSSSAGVQRLELPGEAPTLAELTAAAAGAFDLPSSEDVLLSFNNKDPLGASSETPLRELGVRGGDLLWLLSPAPPPPQPQDAATAPAAPAAEAGAKRARDANDPPAGNTQQQQQQQQQVQSAADKGKQAATAPAGEGQDDGAEAMAVEQEGEADPQPELEPLPPSQRLPAYLLRTLQASWAPSSGPSDVLLLAAHAAMLETGFVPHWPAGSASSSCGDSAFGLPRSCWASSSVCRIQYTLQPGNGDDSSSSAMAEAEEGAAEPGEGAAEQQAAAGPACTLQCSSMGGGAVVLAVSTQSHARHLALRAGAFVQPLESASAGGGAAVSRSRDGAGPSSAVAAEAAEGPSSAVQLLSDGGLALGGHLHLGATAAKQLWTRLKDGLAFPMLLAAYAEAGLAPPAGLLALPEDLKQRVLEGLGPHDLATLCCACRELRHLASQDALWRPLFDKDFPRATQWYAEQARTRGYKWAYGQAWRERRQREEALRRARSRAFVPAVPRFGIPRPPPFYPAPPPGHHPFIIGGDYDRLPQFGPNGGGMPGQFGGGHMFGGLGGGPGGGPSPFLGGSRRQGGRGSSGGFRMY